MSTLLRALRIFVVYGGTIYVMLGVVTFLRVSLLRAGIGLLGSPVAYHGTYIVAGLWAGFLLTRVIKLWVHVALFLLAVPLCVFALFKLTRGFY